MGEQHTNNGVKRRICQPMTDDVSDADWTPTFESASGRESISRSEYEEMGGETGFISDSADAQGGVEDELKELEQLRERVAELENENARLKRSSSSQNGSTSASRGRPRDAMPDKSSVDRLREVEADVESVDVEAREGEVTSEQMSWLDDRGESLGDVVARDRIRVEFEEEFVSAVRLSEGRSDSHGVAWEILECLLMTDEAVSYEMLESRLSVGRRSMIDYVGDLEDAGLVRRVRDAETWVEFPEVGVRLAVEEARQYV